MSEVDLLLPAIRARTLVIHNRDHPLWPVEGGRYLAANIPGARYLEYAEGFAGFFDSRERARLAADIEEFLTGSRRAHDADRVLATVLYTDIVGPTERISAMGDGAWRALLAEHERAERAAVRANGGTIVKSLGDGFLLRFDLPTRPGEVLVTSTVRDLVLGSAVSFEERGSHELRGVPGRWTILAVGSTGADE